MWRFFTEFLLTHERQIAKEIRDEYVDTMSKIYYSYFKGYLTRLTKLQVMKHAAIMLCEIVLLHSEQDLLPLQGLFV